jgi:hypothetical protein
MRQTLLRDESWQKARSEAAAFCATGPAPFWVLLDDGVELHDTASINDAATDRGLWVLEQAKLCWDLSQVIDAIKEWWGQ